VQGLKLFKKRQIQRYNPNRFSEAISLRNVRQITVDNVFSDGYTCGQFNLKAFSPRFISVFKREFSVFDGPDLMMSEG
jgi:hypothetical protein